LGGIVVKIAHPKYFSDPKKFNLITNRGVMSDLKENPTRWNFRSTCTFALVEGLLKYFIPSSQQTEAENP
jgi:hypothetical protein